MESEQPPTLVDQKRKQISRARHVEELEEGPAKTVGLATDHGQRADTLHREDEEEQDR